MEPECGTWLNMCVGHTARDRTGCWWGNEDREDVVEANHAAGGRVKGNTGERTCRRGAAGARADTDLKRSSRVGRPIQTQEMGWAVVGGDSPSRNDALSNWGAPWIQERRG
eukprot:8793038-Pyramimonas_sp.AAC.1